MKCQLSKSNFILFIVIILLILYIIWSGGFRKIDNRTQNIIIYDTTYNTQILDSIEYDIIVKDSIITNLIYVYEEEFIKAENLDDSSAVELFKQLCTGYSLYGQDNGR